MISPSNRRTFLAGSAAAAAALALPLEANVVKREPGTRLKLAMNAYCFDKALRDGSMTLADAVRFCADQNVDALDATGYYFPGYPDAPPDRYIYDLKRTAFVNGIAISGTGIRNDFTKADAAARAKDVQMIKNWVVVASKLSAPVIRVFTGPTRPEGHTFEEALAWMTKDFQECAAFGKEHGIVIAVQPHNDFLKTAAETIRLIDGVGSDWFGCILDIGSVRQSPDPYAEVEKLVPYAVSWQIKEKVGRNNQEETTDLAKVKALIDRTGYRGYVPFESLGGTGDVRPKVIAFLNQVRKAFAV